MEARQPQFYKTVVPLNVERHGQLHIDAAAGYGFAREATSVFLTAVEFNRAALEYPIVFLEEGENLNPVALLGIPGGENQFVREDGTWEADYIPAYVRRYPFIPATMGANTELTICIDEGAAILSRESGQPLFEEGRNTVFLNNCITLLQDYQAHVNRTAEFSSSLKSLNLLKPMKADLKNDGAGATIKGFLVVDKVRLKALRPKQLSSLVKKDEMDLIYAHLLSLANFRKLASVLQGRAPAGIS